VPPRLRPTGGQRPRGPLEPAVRLLEELPERPLVEVDEVRAAVLVRVPDGDERDRDELGELLVGTPLALHPRPEGNRQLLLQPEARLPPGVLFLRKDPEALRRQEEDVGEAVAVEVLHEIEPERRRLGLRRAVEEVRRDDEVLGPAPLREAGADVPLDAAGGEDDDLQARRVGEFPDRPEIRVRAERDRAVRRRLEAPLRPEKEDPRRSASGDDEVGAPVVIEVNGVDRVGLVDLDPHRVERELLRRGGGGHEGDQEKGDLHSTARTPLRKST